MAVVEHRKQHTSAQWLQQQPLRIEGVTVQTGRSEWVTVAFEGTTAVMDKGETGSLDLQLSRGNKEEEAEDAEIQA